MEKVRNITIAGHNLKLEVFPKGSGQNPKWLLSVNDETYYSINYYNFKKHNELSWSGIIQDLEDGAYKMFIKN
tara:strand:- start:229 stop:447 length:219 start_codon:yes stop_codon:yes gene_type:complete